MPAEAVRGDGKFRRRHSFIKLHAFPPCCRFVISRPQYSILRLACKLPRLFWHIIIQCGILGFWATSKLEWLIKSLLHPILMMSFAQSVELFRSLVFIWIPIYIVHPVLISKGFHFDVLADPSNRSLNIRHQPWPCLACGSFMFWNYEWGMKG